MRLKWTADDADLVTVTEAPRPIARDGDAWRLEGVRLWSVSAGFAPGPDPWPGRMPIRWELGFAWPRVYSRVWWRALGRRMAEELRAAWREATRAPAD